MAAGPEDVTTGKCWGWEVTCKEGPLRPSRATGRMSKDMAGGEISLGTGKEGYGRTQLWERAS